MSAFDHEGAALGDIAARPEVTGTMPDEAARKPLKVAMVADTSPGDDARNGRLLAGTVASAYRGIKGQDVEKDRLDAVAEVGEHAFAMLREFAVPKPIYLGILGLMLIAPVIPPMIAIFKPQAKEGQNVNRA